jgi:transcriptional regulator with XRE-family HTH domain
MPASKILQRYGDRIRELRKQKNLTQEKLAEKASLHYTYIGTVERGEKNISMKNVERVARGLGVSLAEFFSTFR